MNGLPVLLLFRYCLFLLLMLPALPGGANRNDIVQASSRQTRLETQVEVLADPSRTLSIDAVRRQTGWMRDRSGYPNFGFSNATIWLRFRLAHGISPMSAMLVELASPTLDEVDFYQFRGNRLIQHLETGASRPIAQRAINHRHFLLPVAAAPGELDEFYIRIRSITSIRTELTVWQEHFFWERDQKILGLHALYYGAMLFIMFYHFVLYLRLRERSYIIYIFNVLALLVTQSYLDGIGAQLFWPHHPGWNERFPALLPPVITIFYFLFLREVLRLETIRPRMNRWVRLNIALATVSLLAVPLVPAALLAQIMPGLITFAAISALCVSYATWFETRKAYARTVAVSATSFLLSVILVALTGLDALPLTALSDFILMIGSTIEMFMLAYALSEHLSEMDQQRLYAEQRVREIKENLLELACQNSIKLERQVEQRTRDLTKVVADVEQLNLQLAELSVTDPLTGAKNRRFFDMQLSQEIKRAQRDDGLLSLVMIDIDHFKQVNDRYGHPAGDECLRILTKVIQSELRRPPDELCRIGGEELALILPGTALEEAVIVAERIRLRIQAVRIASAGLEFGVTASFGVSCSTPKAPVARGNLVADADKALYQAKTTGRNRVCRDMAETPCIGVNSLD